MLYRFSICYNLFCTSFSCKSMPHSGCSALHGVNPNLKKYRKPTSCILLSLIINIYVLKIYFKYTFYFANKQINLEGLLPVYFWVWTLIHKFRQTSSSLLLSLKIKHINIENPLKVYFWALNNPVTLKSTLKYTSM